MNNENEFSKLIEQSNHQIKNFTRISVVLIILGSALFISEILCFIFYPTLLNKYSLNSLGDSIAGTVGPIWSLASFFVVYIAFLGQKQQILQQQEEIKSQNKEMVLQNKHIGLQRFETTFFNLLTHHANTVKDLHLNDPSVNKEFRGRETFQSKHYTISNIFDPKNNQTLTKENATQFIIKENKVFGHYLRGLYHILKYIDSSTDAENKYKYTSILRASIDSYEYLLLFVYGISDYGSDYFRPLVEKYSLFKGFDQTLLKGVILTDYFNEVAFFTNSQRRENGLGI